MHHDLGPQIRAQRLGPLFGAVGNADLGHTYLDQRRHHRPRAPARPQHCRRAAARLPVRRILAQVCHEPGAIGVVGIDAAILAEDQRICRPDQRRPVGNDIRQTKDRLLVRNRHVQPDETDLRQEPQRLGQVGLRHIHRDVVPLHPIAAQPVAVQRGRTRMRDRRSDDASQGKARMVGHVGINPLSPRYPSSGNSGRPSTVK